MNKKPNTVTGTDENGMFCITRPKLKPSDILILFLLFLALFSNGQTVTVKNQDGTYSAQKKERAKTEAKDTGKKFKTADGQTLPIFESKNGKYFVVRTSKKTGANYNQYISIQ